MRIVRFSVFDLFVITLGVAVGLAYHRLSGVRWTDAFLVCCATWIAVGMVQQTWSAFVVWRSLAAADSFICNGAVLAMIRPVAVLAMFAAAIGFEIAKTTDRRPVEYWAFDGFTPSLFSLAAICAYTSPARREVPRLSPRKTAVRFALDVVALLLGAVLLVYTLVSMQAVSGLVHIAIRGLEATLPTRWAGKPFHPFDLQNDLTRQFFQRAVAAASAAAFSATCTFLVAIDWNRRARRWLLIAAAFGSIGFAAYLDNWYWTVGYPSLSPFLAQYTGTQPWYIVAAGLSVAASACFLFVMRYALEPCSRASTAEPGLPRAFHLSQPVMILLSVAMIAQGMPDWWDFGSSASLLGLPGPFSELQSWWNSGARLIELPPALLQIAFSCLAYWIDEPKMLLRFAAVLVVANQLRRLRRGEANEVVVPVRASKLITISLLAAATLLVVIPAAAWLGFAIMTTTFVRL